MTRHQKQHESCLFPTKAACEDARKAVFGQCRALKENKREPEPCTNWALNQDGYCGVHLPLLARQLEGTFADRRIAEKKADLNRRIDTYIAQQPVRDQKVEDWLTNHAR